jgi:hypothetical protein
MKQVYVSPHFRNNSLKTHPKNVYKSPLLSSYTKKGLNPYFSFNNENYDTSSEVQLIKELQQEQIRMHGYNVTYIVRTNNTLDDIYGESIGSTFKHSFRLEALAETSDLMLGRDAIMGYGYSMTDTVVLTASLDRVREEIAKLGVRDTNVPVVGDLIAFDIPGNIMEIKYIEDKAPAYLKGTWTVYTFYCQVFNVGQETFDTGDDEVDFLNEFNKTYEYPHADNEILHDEAKEVVKSEPNAWNLDFNKAFKYN